mmetsp:Transcript_36846/g.113731  ORF Transcript_36846/g.113731 Transcript_36846/m.113731 type:complete len:255 (-) Transcript_36846:170-934(-)
MLMLLAKRRSNNTLRCRRLPPRRRGQSPSREPNNRRTPPLPPIRTRERINVPQSNVPAHQTPRPSPSEVAPCMPMTLRRRRCTSLLLRSTPPRRLLTMRPMNPRRHRRQLNRRNEATTRVRECAGQSLNCRSWSRQSTPLRRRWNRRVRRKRQHQCHRKTPMRRGSWHYGPPSMCPRDLPTRRQCSRGCLRSSPRCRRFFACCAPCGSLWSAPPSEFGGSRASATPTARSSSPSPSPPCSSEPRCTSCACTRVR